MITGLLFAILFIALALVFLAGKGDKLIAGYNTASEGERSKVDIHRLRILMAICSFLGAALCVFLGFCGEDKGKSTIAVIVFIVLTIVIIILSNTWAKKK
jgi:drug/metabolite transporter (DMT)-like permease